MRWTIIRCTDCGRPVREEAQANEDPGLEIGPKEICAHCGRSDKLAVEPPRWWAYLALGTQNLMAQVPHRLKDLLEVNVRGVWFSARRLTRAAENHDPMTGATRMAEVLWVAQLAKLVSGEVHIRMEHVLLLSPLTEDKERELSKRWLEIEQSGGPEISRGGPASRIKLAGAPLPKSILRT